MKFDLKKILKEKVFIIAEAGVNHNGDLKLAYKLVDIAKKANVDAVKFQTFVTEESISKTSEMAPYQKESLKNNGSQFDMAKALELTQDQFRSLKKYCDRKKILFLSTPDEEISLDFLCRINVSLIKIGSGEITNIPLLKAVARTKKLIILSTGASDMKEVSEALKIMRKAGAKEICLLHCVTEYPAPMKELNLRAMLTMKEKLKVSVGFSDHTLGIEASIAAVAMGARVIEKHFTISKSLKGPDHKASLSPKELAQLVSAIRNVEKAMGDGIKKPAACEKKNVDIIRKSLVARRDLFRGEKIRLKDIAVKKPGYGIAPADLGKVVGRRAVKNIKEDQLITWDQIK